MLEVHNEVVTEFWLTTLAAIEFAVGLCGHTAALTGARHVISRCLFRVPDNSVFTPWEVRPTATRACDSRLCALRWRGFTVEGCR
jgi:hypothetical protein